MNKFARGSLLIFAGLFFGRILAMLTNVAMARRLGTHDFGVYLIGLSIFQIAATVSNIGIPGILPRFLAGCDDGRQQERVSGLLATSTGLCLITTVLVSILIYAFSKEISISVFKIPELTGMLRVISFAIPVSVVTSVFISAFRGFEKTRPKVIFQDLLPALLTLMLFFSLSYCGFGLTAAYLAFTCSSGIILVLTLPTLGKALNFRLRFQSADFATARGLLALSWPLGIESVVWITYGQIDKLLIGFFLPPSDVGIYAAAASVTVILSIIPQAFSYLSLPVFSTLLSNRATDELRRVYKKTAKTIFQVSFPVFLCLIVLSKEIPTVLYGGKYSDGAMVLTILAVGSIWSCFLGPAKDLLVGAGKTAVPLLASSAGCACNVSLNIVLIPKYGIHGAAAATCVSSLVSVLVTGFFIQRHFKMLPWDHDYVLWPAICLGLTPVITLTTHVLQSCSLSVSATLTGLMYCIITYTLLYGFSLRKFGKDSSEK